jgi:hypothetical protein
MGCGRGDRSAAVRPKLDLAGLGKPKPREYLLRFLFGGAVTVAAMLVTKRYPAG